MTNAELVAFNIGVEIANPRLQGLNLADRYRNTQLAGDPKVQEARRSLGAALFEEWVWKGQVSVSQR